MTSSRRIARLPLVLIALTALCAALVLIPRVVQAQSQTPDQNAVVWSADMLVVEYTEDSIGAASADLFSNIGGTGDLEIRSLWTHVPNRDIRLAFQEGIPDADDLTLVVGDLTLEFPPGSSGNGSFKWTDVDVDWEDGQTISVSIVLTSALEEPEKQEEPADNTPASGAPTISGTAQVDETLTAETSSIADDDGLTNVSYSYQWVRSDDGADTDIAGETNSTYTLVFADQGKTIKVRVSFTDDADNEETLTSEATVEVAAAPNRPATGAPTISGTPQIDQTLTAGTSDIADEDGVNDVSYSYQWMADDVNIDGATGSTYVLANADAGKAISVRVSFTDDRNNAEARTSVATAAVLPTVPTQPLSLNVTPGDQIQELDASWQAPSSNGGSSITGYRVQWKRFADSWDTEADVSQATVTGTTHTIPELTGGVEYAVRVIASNTAGDGSASDEVTGTPAGGTSQQQTGDSTAPTVSSIAITSDPGSDEVYAIGDAIQITVTFSADVTVTGKPQLELDIGGNAKPAEYQSTNASSTVFNYTVAEGDSDTDGIAVAENKLTLNGGTIKDASDNAADLDHVALEARPGHKVDGVRPTISLVRMSGISSARMSGTRANVGDLVHVSVDFTEEIFLDGSPHITLDIDSAASRVASLIQIGLYCPVLEASTSDPVLAVNIPEGEEPPPGVTSYCFWSDTHGITMLFHYTVAKGDLDTDGVGIPANSLSLNGGTLRDAAGNDAVITHEAVADNPSVLIDGVPPEITSIEITSDPGEDDTYAEGDTIKFNVTFSENLEFFGFGWTRLRLDIGGKTRMAYGVKRDILDIRSDETGYIMAYAYTVADGDNDEDGISFPANALHKIRITVLGTDGNHAIFENEAIADNAEHKVATATTAEDYTDDTQKTGFLMISGTLNVGETVNADFSNVDDEDGVEYAVDTAYFDWSREGGGGGLLSRFDTRYIIAASDKGKRLRVSTSFFDDNGNEEYLTSPWTEPVAAAPNSSAMGLPTISGTAQVGETLTADTATIADEDGLTNVSYSYQWIRNDGTSDADIGGQTDSTYTLVAADQGKTIKVKVTFTDDDDNAETLTSVATEAVAAAPNSSATGLPTISGTAQVGETLTADTATIADEDGLTNVSYGYQWIRNYTQGSLEIVEIAEATDSTYTLRPADIGGLGPAVVSVRVSFTDDAGNDESLTSEPFGPFRPAPAEECPGAGDGPTPVEVAVDAVPIVVESTAEEYFVLYVLLDPAPLLPSEVLVSVTLGQEPNTMLTDQLSALPIERYRVEKYLITDPADVDGDCIDDVTEIQDSGMSPVNPAPAVSFADGVVAIPDHETFEALLKENSISFLVFGLYSDHPAVYFINNDTHYGFINSVNLRANPLYWEGATRGEIEYHPDVIAPDGHLGVYLYNFRPNQSNSFARVALIHEVLAAGMPVVDNNLAYRPTWPIELERYDLDQALYDDSRVNVMLEEDILRDVDFIPFNQEEGYGFLRVMSLEERPNPRDIVIYEALPNELSRVAGIITTVPQTRLSHVNLRAVQDGVPNAFIRVALDDDDFDDLIGSFVHYTVTEDGYSISAATRAEVDAHYSDSRPAQTQTPERDLTITEITDLDDIGFDDWDVFGVKAANVAVLRTLGFPEGTVPDGFAVPFYFYDEFMKHNEFYEDIEEMLADPDFQSDFDTQESELKKLRKKIKKGESPQWMIDALVAMHATFPEGQSLRYRSSTNNEDLPGFSGAGLYDSKTQKPDETEEDGIDKSLKQVFASMWNFRAFTEREFHRIDHLAAAMGVLVHPNFSDELANGVAVTFNPIVGGVEGYYVNTQLGEDLVTNPEALSVPEEMLLHEDGRHEIISTSNRVEAGELLMSDAQIDQLRRHLEVIHDKFEELYGIEAGEKFAMEIEFKITSENVLSIKQARPWVFSHVEDNSEATGKPTISGTAQVDETLTAQTSDISDADGLTNVVFSYQWIRSESGTDTDIQNATGSTYTLGVEDEGKTVKVMVSFTDDAGNEETLTSEGTEAVVPNPNSPATGLPTISGTAQVDETLTAQTSDISDADGLTNVVFSYQWIRSESGTDTDISDETGSTYVLSGDDQGKTVKVMVSFTDDAGNQESLTSAATDSVGPSPLVWSADMSVVDLGNGAIGATRSDLFSNEGGSANLQAKWLWYYTPGRYLRLAFTEIVPGVEELTLQIGDVSLTLQAGDSNFSWSDVDVDWEDGQVIRARVVLTSATVETQPNTPATGLPTIDGTAQEDETLTADVSSIADADGLSNVSYSYQWIRNDGISDTDIEDATDASYTVTDDDVAKTIKVRVTFTDDADNEESLTSEVTVLVAATVPTAPLSLTVTAGSQIQEIDVSWQAPSSDGGSAVTGYKVQWKESTDRWDTAAEVSEATETGTTYTITSLTGGVEYAVRVIATNVAGDGPASIEARATPADSTAAWTATLTVGVSGSGSEAVWGYSRFRDGMGTLDKRTYNEGDQTIEVMAILLSNGFVAFNVMPHPSVDFVLTVDGTEFASADASEVKSRTLISYVWATTLDWAEDDSVALSLTLKDTDSAEQSEPAENNPATGAPTIGGTPQVDQTLTADTANIADEDGLTNVSYSYQWIAGGSEIAGATGSSYTLTSSEEGQTVQVRVTFTDDADNEETLTSAPTVEVQQGSNAWSATMTVETRDGYTGYSYWGDPQLGALSETEVEWDGKTHYVRFLFLKDGELRLGLNKEMFSTGFVLSVGDEGFGSADAIVDHPGASYRFRWDDPGLGWSVGQEVSVNLVESKQNTPALGPPTITGTPQVGETLTADTSGVEDADGLTNVSYSYQWVADDTDIGGATGSSYLITSSEQGQTVQVRVTFTDAADNDESLTSAATDAVVAAANTSAAGAPTISGTPQVEQTLTADTSSITDEDGLTNVSYSYQWIAGGSDIGGATGSSYLITSSEQGQTVQVRVSFTDDADNDETLTSAATVEVEEKEEARDDQQVPESPPAKPTGLTATVNADGHIVLSWTAPNDDSITGYQVLRRRPGQGESSLLVYVADTQSTATTFTDTGVTAGVKHVYRVKAINAAGLSGWSNYVNPTALGPGG